MPVEIHINRYSEDFKKQNPIPWNEWKTISDFVDGVRISAEKNAVETFSERLDEWIPIFWLGEDGSGSMRQSGFFDNDESYDAGLEIAAVLNATIEGDEGDIIFLQDYGLLNGKDQVGNINLTTFEIPALIESYGEDINEIISRIISQKESAKKAKETFTLPY